MSVDSTLRLLAYFIAGAQPVTRTPNDPLAESAIHDVYRLFKGAKSELTEEMVSCGTLKSADVILSLTWDAEREDDLSCYAYFFGNDVCSVQWWDSGGRNKWEDAGISVDNLKELGLPDNRTLPSHIRQQGYRGPEPT